MNKERNIVMKYVIVATGLLALSGANTLTRTAPATAASRSVPEATRAAEPAGTARTSIARFAIRGMVSKSCPALLKAAVSRIPGVVRVEADAETRLASVEYRDGSTTPEQIRKVIEDRTGFDAELVE